LADVRFKRPMRLDPPLRCFLFERSQLMGLLPCTSTAISKDDCLPLCITALEDFGFFPGRCSKTPPISSPTPTPPPQTCSQPSLVNTVAPPAAPKPLYEAFLKERAGFPHANSLPPFKVWDFEAFFKASFLSLRILSCSKSPFSASSLSPDAFEG